MKQKSYWLREGVIGLIIGVFISVLFSLRDFNGDTIPLYSEDIPDFIIDVVLSSLPLGILGVVVGLINGEIQDRKKTK